MSNNEKVYLTIFLYVKQNELAIFHQYERLVQPIIEQHGGRFEHVIRPTAVVGDLKMPTEIHWLTFPSIADFEAYRMNSALNDIAHLREVSVEKTDILFGYSLDYLT